MLLEKQNKYTDTVICTSINLLREIGINNITIYELNYLLDGWAYNYNDQFYQVADNIITYFKNIFYTDITVKDIEAKSLSDLVKSISFRNSFMADKIIDQECSYIIQTPIGQHENINKLIIAFANLEHYVQQFQYYRQIKVALIMMLITKLISTDKKSKDFIYEFLMKILPYNYNLHQIITLEINNYKERENKLCIQN